MDLDGKAALVTGGSSGLGRATAFELARAGADVINADIQRPPRDSGTPTDEEIENRGGEGRYVECDVTDLEAVRTAVDTADEFGGLDIVVNNAGHAESYALTDTTRENWSSVVETNLSGVYHGCLAGVEAMLVDGGGSIVNVASVFGVVGGPNAFSYSAAKGGVISLTKSIARDYARDEIRANVVSPGFIDTPMFHEDTHDGTPDFARDQAPMGRIGSPEEVAKAIRYLASDAASFVTGQNLAIDGGYSTV